MRTSPLPRASGSAASPSGFSAPPSASPDDASAEPEQAASSGWVQVARDFAALSKPRLSSLVVFTTMGGYYLAPGEKSRLGALLLFVGTALIVGGANALNMYIERESDSRMNRTRRRPLPAGRLAPRTALGFGLVLGVVSLPILILGVNLLTAVLAVLGFGSYVLAYTPMKRRTSLALLVGTIPGAIPPLMGWTAATGRLQVPGFVLFAIMFLWQIPHFLAIAIYSAEDYARGGIQVVPLVKGIGASKRQIVIYSAALLPVSLLLYPLRVAGPTYLVVALVLGATFFLHGVYGLRASAGRRWARALFATSLLYLTALFIALAVDPIGHG